MSMTLVSTVTIGSGGAANIEFTSIPSTGTDILLTFSLRTNASAQRDARIYINGLTSGYSDRWLYGDGSSTSSGSNGAGGGYWYLNDVLPGTGVTASTFNNATFYIPNYAGSAAKSASCDIVEENNATSSGQLIWAGSHTTTSAITSITLQSSSLNLVQFSTASLYLITKGSGGATTSP